MTAAAQIRPTSSAAHIDQRVHLHGIGWTDYEALLAMRGERSGTRIAYLDGELEFMTPAIDHETQKTLLGRLIETYAEVRGIELQGCGSWTVRKEAKARGVEPDECYVLGLWTDPPPIPDLAVEVIWTSGGIDKLEVYRGLGVPEAWFWQDAALRIFLFDGDRYTQSPCSRLLPDLDPDLIVRFMACPSQTQAVRGLRAALGDAMP
jgi:Uma2 family endonuclease